MNKIYFVSLILLICQCSNNEVPDGKIGIDTSGSDEEIVAQILKHTPIGSDVEDVLEFINLDLHRRTQHQNKRTERPPVRYEEYSKIPKAPDWPKGGEPAGLIFAGLDVKGWFAPLVISGCWYFDNDGKLIKVAIIKLTGAP